MMGSSSMRSESSPSVWSSSEAGGTGLAEPIYWRFLWNKDSSLYDPAIEDGLAFIVMPCSSWRDSFS